MKIFTHKTFRPTRVFQNAWKFFGRESSLELDKKSNTTSPNKKVRPYNDPPVSLYMYNKDHFEELHNMSLDEALEKYAEALTNHRCWIDVEGQGDAAFIKKIGQYFGLHELEVEDMAKLYQRPKVEEYGEHIFVVSRMIYYSQLNGNLVNEQVSFFVFDNILLTVQEENEDAFEPVRIKLRKGGTALCEANTFHLAWALMDAIVDNYFPILERIGNDLDRIEDELLNRPNKRHLTELQQIKREVFFLRKSIWAERDKLNELLRNESVQIDERTRLYLRDTYDHTVQIMDIIEGHKEISYSLMEIYLSSQNNRMSEVMKVLTVISSIFIPLTFVVGVYGMNFQPADHQGNPLNLNMPELYWPHGYLIVMAIMLAIALGQVLFFRKKGWL